MMPIDPSSSSKSTATGLIRRTWNRRWVPLLTRWAILSVALVATAFMQIKPIYRATTLIRVDPSKTNLFAGPEKGENFEQIMQTQIHLMNSPNVLTVAATDRAAAKLPRILESKDVVLELRKVIQVHIVPGTSLIEVAMESESPTETVTLVNAVTDAYIDSNSEWADGMTRLQIKNLEAYLNDLKSQSQLVAARWKELVKPVDHESALARNGLINADHAQQIEAKLIEADIKKIEIQTRLAMLRRQNDPTLSAQVQALQAEMQAVELLETNFKERLGTLGPKPKANAVVEEADVILARDSLKTLNSMEESVIRRLEQLKFDAKGEARVRKLAPATPPGRPFNDGGRLKMMIAIPFATFLFVYALFMAVEARLSRKSHPISVESPNKPMPENEES